MSQRNLLIAIIDTNPIWWGMQSSGLILAANKSNANKAINQDNLTFNDCMSAIVGFLNTYKAMSQSNSVALIAAHNNNADYLYPNRSKVFDKNASPWDKYDQINDIDEQIQKNLKKLTEIQLNNLRNENLANESMITSAIGLALCYINRVLKKCPFADSAKYRILIIKASQDSSNQYMNFMNMIFSAEKLGVVIDSLTLVQDSSLLQQASSLTNGFYFKLPELDGILNYLLWLFLPDEETRKMLVYPIKSEVDFRAACFCHHKLIDVGYVCSVCLSVFCSFTPICTTCNTNFKFDVNMLKKATSLKHGSTLASKLARQTSLTLERNSNSNSNSNLDEYGAAQRLASQFQDTSINSPANMPTDEQMSSIEMDNMIDQQDQQSSTDYFHPMISTRIITAVAPNPNGVYRSNKNQNLNDSLDMLE